MKDGQPLLTRASVYFSLSLILTILFVLACPLYISRNQLILSLSIAGGKWIIQGIGAFLFLRKRASAFLHGLGRTCFLGSLILVPYFFFSFLEISDDTGFFFGSLIVAIAVMVLRYYTEVTRLGLSLWWWYGWLLCLAMAVFMQMTLVFHLF